MSKPKYWIVEQIGERDEDLKWTPIVSGSAFYQMLEERNEARDKLEEIISYMPKVPTSPYEKRLAQELREARARFAKIKDLCAGSGD